MRQEKAKNKREKPRTQRARQTGNGRKSGKRKHAGRETTATERRAHLREASRTAAGRRHPCTGAAATGQTKPHTQRTQQAAAGRTAAQTHSSCSLQTNTGSRMPEQPGTKAAATAAGRAKTASPAHGAARRAQKNPSEQAKFAFALLPARRGLVNRGRQKIASLFLAGTVFLLRVSDLLRAFCGAQRCTKGGAAPFYPLQAF